jgi:benzoylformate decarboxylase
VPGTLTPPGTRVAVVTGDPVEAHRSVADLAVLAPIASVCSQLARRLPAREVTAGEPLREPLAVAAAHNPLSTEYVFDQLAARLGPNAVVIEESPSSRPALLERVPAREPLGFLSPAMGGLGFAIPAATGIRMARPDRPVVAVVGDGSSLYSIQALWSAAHYGVGALFVILANGGYAIMDRLLERGGGGDSPWPSFSGIDISGLAQAFGCPAQRVSTPEELVDAFDAVVPQLADREEPLLLEVAVEPPETFDP